MALVICSDLKEWSMVDQLDVDDFRFDETKGFEYFMRWEHQTLEWLNL